MTAKELRKKYLDFFKKKGHSVIPSASLVPEHDPTVLFTTAGMHPLVPFLMGEDHPSGKRLVNVQKSLRTDDIDEVGDPWHNTFFEMLGNWSLGDSASPDGIGQGGYWKKEAIEWSFEFLTTELGLDPEKIHVTVFGGDKEIPGVPEDKESIEIWKSLGIPKGRIFKLGKEDNWWGPVGNTGPCGPDTEMFYDTGRPTHGEKCQPGETCGKYAEIWNDVFMEFNKTADDKYEALKQKNVDTGMGVERVTAILQGKDSVYDTELFAPPLHKIFSILRVLFDPNDISINSYPITAGSKLNHKESRRLVRIILDHVRASVFLIADGVEPKSADARGSVLVRLITRSITSGRKIGIQDSFLSKITDSFVDTYKSVYPDLDKSKEKIGNLVSLEEQKYRFKALSNKSVHTQDQAIEAVLQRYKNERERQNFIAAKATTISGMDWKFTDLQEKFPQVTSTPSGAIGTISAELKTTEGIPPEESFSRAEDILGKQFDSKEASADLNVMIDLHREASKKKGPKKFSGGLADHSDITVRGHTATHLLHQALRDVLGDAVHQTGSNITPERIRFDFAHNEKLTEEQIKKIEETVNSKIKNDLKVNKSIMSAEEADKIGAIGLFKDKYAQKVSIYKIGDYSVEYCGGPHVQHTAEVGNFKIIKEKALGSGQRRIRAILDSV